MPIEASAILTGFSGVQLIALAWVVYELNNSKALHAKQSAKLDRVSEKVAHIAGRLNIPNEENHK